MELRDYLLLGRRYWRIVAAAVVIGMVGAWVLTDEDASAPGEPNRPVTSFEATHTLIRSAESIVAGSSNTSMSLLALLATTGEVPQRVADALGEDDPALLMTGVQANGDNELGTLRITARHATDGELAAALANTTATELIDYLRDSAQATQQQQVEDSGEDLRLLEERIERLQASIPEEGDPVLEAQLAALVRQYGATFERNERLITQPPAAAGLITLQRATPVPVLGSGPAFSPPQSLLGKLLAGLGVGLAAGIGIALLLHRFSTRLRTREELEDAFRLPVVAEVPSLPRGRDTVREVTVQRDPLSDVAEAYRQARLAIEHMPSQVLARSFGSGDADDALGTPLATSRSHRVVLVTSPGPSEGKTSTVANLAVCFAEAGRTVAVIDADTRRAELSDLVAAREGDAIHEGEAPAVGLLPTRIEGVWLLPAQDLLTGTRREARQRVVADIRKVVDIVLIDTAPILLSAAAADLAPECDTVLLVVRSGRTRSAEAERVIQLLARLGVPILGVALIGADEALLRGGYRYYAPTGRADPETAVTGNGAGATAQHHGSARPTETHPIPRPRSSTRRPLRPGS